LKSALNKIVIRQNEDVIQQDIAEIMKKDKSVVLRQIDNLEKKI
jgi:DNA-binding MarR family transcriptional regulator